MSSAIDGIAWDKLEDAYGKAHEVPGLLKQIAVARGQNLFEVMDLLCSRVLHQGTIYSSSPPVARITVEFLKTTGKREKPMFYGLLSGFAEAARQAIHDGRAIPCHAGGDPADGAAIRDVILNAHALFAGDLANPDTSVRTYAAELLTAFPDADRAVTRLVLERYPLEPDTTVRQAMLEGLIRVSASFEDWSGFLGRTLDQEHDPSNRFLLRYAQVREGKEAANSEMVTGLVSSFVQVNTAAGYFGDREDRFFEALRWIGPGRELTALRQAFGLANEPELCLALTQHLLRRVFEDQRAKWGNTSVQVLNKDGSQPPHPGLTRMLVRSVAMLLLMKVFPFLFRRWLRRKSDAPSKGIKKLEYWGLEGNAPPLPSKLDELQRSVLLAAADKTPLWEVKTNLWELFGLPDSAGALRQFVAERS